MKSEPVTDMEKPDLYYIVITGTNDRVQAADKIPLIVRPGSVGDVLEMCKDRAKDMGYISYTFEEITIEEFERIFTEEEEWYLKQSY